MAEQWNLTGTYFETCNCEAACPCVFLSPPSTGECTVLIAWHIDQGRSDDVALDGLNVALAVHSPGHMMQVQWKALAGQGEEEITVNNHPLCVAPGYPAVVSKSTRFTYRDHGLAWELSEKNGFYSPFRYAGP
jgi:hypothetical protein